MSSIETICYKLTNNWNSNKATILAELKVNDGKDTDEVTKMDYTEKNTLLSARKKFIDEANECKIKPFVEILTEKKQKSKGGKSNKKRKMTKKRKSIKKRV